MNMKKYLLTAILCLMAIQLSGQGRLIESSAEKRPAWVKRDVGKFDLTKVSYESTVSLEDAENKAFDKLYNLIANSVTAYLASTNVNGPDTGELMSRVRNSDFLKDINESTAIQTYWEERLVKKQNVYIYYILYEFNDFEKKRIALEINRENSTVTKELDKLK